MDETPRLAVQIAEVGSRQQHRGHRGGGSKLIEVRGSLGLQQLLRSCGVGTEIRPGVWHVTMEELCAVLKNPGMDRPD